MPASTRRTLVTIAALAATTAWLYAPVVSSLVGQWASDDNYSHGFFVLPLALFFAWERRAALRESAVRPTVLGLGVIAGSLLMLVAGLLGAELFLTRVSLVGVIAGSVLFVWGTRHFRKPGALPACAR